MELYFAENSILEESKILLEKWVNLAFNPCKPRSSSKYTYLYTQVLCWEVCEGVASILLLERKIL